MSRPISDSQETRLACLPEPILSQVLRVDMMMNDEEIADYFLRRGCASQADRVNRARGESSVEEYALLALSEYLQPGI